MGNTVRTITDPDLDMYRHHLESEEKSRATTEKYIRDVKALKTYIGNQSITKGLIIAYKNHLQNHYKATSINSMLAGINSFLTFMGWQEYRVKQLRIQRQPYSQEEKELSRAEYFRLLDTAKKEGKKRLNAVLQTLCGTGIRVSELPYFTVEAVKKGRITVHCKNKTRVILIPAKLRLMLLGYSRNSGITKGKIFITKNGNALDRSNLWTEMRRLCKAARVSATKVFPHNLRKLFAKVFYQNEKDIAKLADILGHTSINTTRIYIMTSGAEHLRIMDRLGFIRD